MSYSFSIKAPNKEAARAAVEAQFDATVLAHQPIHARDRAAILANASAVIDLVADDDTKDVTVSCNGYLSWSGAGAFTPETAPVGSASIGCYAALVAREA